MAVGKLSAAQLRAALRLGDSTEETAEADRLLKFARALIEKRYPNVDMAACNEAVIRIAGFLYDCPFYVKRTAASVLRDSGAGDILLEWFEPRGRSTND